MERKITQVNTSTGEVLDGFVAVIQPKRRNGFNGGWVAMNQNALAALAQIKSTDQMRVLFALLAVLDFDNLIQISQVEVAETLGMHKQHVQRAIKALIERGALIEGPRIGKSRSYRLNPHFGWKGSAKSHNEALKARMRERGLSVVTPEGDAHLQDDLPL